MSPEGPRATYSPIHRSAVLTVTNPSGQRSRAVLNQSPFLFGRQADNHLVLRDNRISRIHARIVQQDGEYILEDLESRHGTYLNGVRMTGAQRLAPGDVVTFGFADSYQLQFHEDDAAIQRLTEQISVPAGASNLAKLRGLVEVARALQSSLSMQEVLDSIVDAALTVTGSDRGFLFLRTGGELKLQVARDRAGNSLAEDDLEVPRSVIERALNARRDLLSMNFDPQVADSTSPDHSVAALELRSVVCVPLIRVRTGTSQDTIVSTSNDTVGLIYMDSRVDLADLSAGNREILQTLALEASTVVENARLLDQERAKQRLESELQIARQIQQTLYPEVLPAEGWFRAAAVSIPSDQVGGDYYDVIQVDRSHWVFLVADVSGKGVSSALLASLLQGAFLLAPVTPEHIREMLLRLNSYLYQRAQGEKYATLFYGAMRDDGLLHWCNAGHCAPILLHADGSLETLEPGALPVGMLDFGDYGTGTTRLAAGDKVVIYSDGISEARDPGGNHFETGRIRRVLAAAAGAPAGECHAAVLESVRAFTRGAAQSDDMTLLIAEYRPGG